MPPLLRYPRPCNKRPHHQAGCTTTAWTTAHSTHALLSHSRPHLQSQHSWPPEGEGLVLGDTVAVLPPATLRLHFSAETAGECL